MSERIHIFVPYSPDKPWVVRRESAVLGKFNDFQGALTAAHDFAAELQHRLMTSVDVKVQSANGQWSINQHKVDV
ncbi:MAG: hypothetical protein ABW154_02265 [Dyella sp.]